MRVHLACVLRADVSTRAVVEPRHADVQREARFGLEAFYVADLACQCGGAYGAEV
jgi:hypothetical protein